MKALADMMREGVVLYDGAKGTMLQRMGLGELPAERWNLENPGAVSSLHRAYVQAGSEVIQANTFSLNRIALSRFGFQDKASQMAQAAIELAKEAGPIICASAGGTGELMQPMGTLSFEKAVQTYAELATAIEQSGGEYLHFETFTDLCELRAAMLAARENTGLSILASATFEQGRTLAGNPPECVALMAHALGAICVGANCGTGPDSLLEPIARMGKVTSLPMLVRPNAGLPIVEDGKLHYSMGPEEFCKRAREFVELGVRLYGGCCGTEPAHIKALGSIIGDLQVEGRSEKEDYLASSREFLKLAEIGHFGTLDLNGSELRAAIEKGDVDAVVDEALELETDAICLDFGGLHMDEEMWDFLCNFCMSVYRPLIFRCEDAQTLERALRYYAGVAGVLCCGCPEEQALAKKYGARIVKPCK